MWEPSDSESVGSHEPRGAHTVANGAERLGRCRPASSTRSRSQSRSRSRSRSTSVDADRADTAPAAFRIPLPRPPVMPGTEWWAETLYTAGEHFRQKLPKYPSRPLRHQSLLSGLMTESFAFEALGIEARTEFVVDCKPAAQKWLSRVWEGRYEHLISNLADVCEGTAPCSMHGRSCTMQKHADLVTVGLPCQPFTSQRDQKRTKPCQHKLYPVTFSEFPHFVDMMQPSGFIVEQVMGFDRLDSEEHTGQTFLQRFCNLMASKGFSVKMCASLWGEAERKRLYIVGVKQVLGGAKAADWIANAIQAEKKLIDLKKQKRAIVADMMQALISCARAATKWQVGEVEKSSIRDLQAGYTILVAEGHVIPKASKMEFAAKIADEYSSAGRWGAWAAVLSLELPSKDTSFISSPTFGAVLPHRTAIEDLAIFWDIWKRSFLNDAFVAMVQAANNGYKELVEIVSAWSVSASQSQLNLPEYASEQLQGSVRLCLGIWALLDPTPGIGGSSQADVFSICPLEASKKSDANLETDFGSPGKVLSRCFRNDTFWKKRSEAYRQTLGGEVRFGKRVLDLKQKLDEWKSLGAEHINKDEGYKLIQEFVENAGEWTKALRKGALAALDDEVGIACDLLFRLCCEEGPSPEGIAQLGHLEAALGAMGTPRTNVLQGVQEKCAEWTKADRFQQLVRAATANMASQAEVLQLRAALEGVGFLHNNGTAGSGGSDMPENLKSTLTASRWYLWKRVVVIVQTEYEYESAMQCLSLIQDIENCIADDIGDDLQASRGLQETLSKFVSIRRALEPGCFSCEGFEALREVKRIFVDDRNAESPLGCPWATTLWKSLQVYAQSNFDELKQQMNIVVTGYLKQALAEVNTAISQVVGIAAGGTGGKSWAAKYKESDGDIIKHFSATLDKINPGALESKMTRLKEAMDKLVSDASTLDTHNDLPDIAGDIDHMAKKATDLWIRARMTKCEVLVVRSLRDSRKKAENCAKYTASFTNDTGEDWRAHMHPAVVARVEPLLST